jgi:hypothetical protein
MPKRPAITQVLPILMKTPFEQDWGAHRCRPASQQQTVYHHVDISTYHPLVFDFNKNSNSTNAKELRAICIALGLASAPIWPKDFFPAALTVCKPSLLPISQPCWRKQSKPSSIPSHLIKSGPNQRNPQQRQWGPRIAMSGLQGLPTPTNCPAWLSRPVELALAQDEDCWALHANKALWV